MSYVEIPKILLPNDKIDLQKWSVIACDQFTSQPEYWDEVKKNSCGSKSTLEMILPEVYLKNIEKEKVISKINNTMLSYLHDGTFVEVNNFIFIDREIEKNIHRYGLMVAVDLEAYDYSPKSNLAIKATEKTVPERLPIRIEIRKDASIELPHIILLMDDVKNTIFSELKAKTNKMKKLYDFDLMLNGGNIKGYLVEDSNRVKEQLLALTSKENLRSRYGSDENDMLFVVGDGNHSLATAKECWNLIKKDLSKEEQESHPARYALCELQNLHDEAVEFLPIHRVLLNCGQEFITFMQDKLFGDGIVKMYFDHQYYDIKTSVDPTIAIAQIQAAIDEFLISNKNVEIDYIHGDDYLLEIANRDNAVAIFMPNISKDSLFRYVLKNGVMPRKSFSIGHAENKRYYLEAKRVKI